MLISPEFHLNSKFYCNKIPLGSIQVPYNLNQTSDLYSEYGAQKFHFKCLTNEDLDIT